MLITKNFYYFFIRIFIILYNIKLNDKRLVHINRTIFYCNIKYYII